LTRRQRPPKPDFPDPADSQQMSAGFDQSLEGRVGVFNFRTLSESDEFVSEGILDR